MAGISVFGGAGGGGSFQPLDSDLTTIAGLTATTDNFMEAVAGAWASVTPTYATSKLNQFTTTLKGLVPPPTAVAGKFLKDDGTWAVPATGSATADDVSVDVTGARYTSTPDIASAWGQIVSNFAGLPEGGTLDTQQEVDDILAYFLFQIAGFVFGGGINADSLPIARPRSDAGVEADYATVDGIIGGSVNAQGIYDDWALPEILDLGSRVTTLEGAGSVNAVIKDPTDNTNLIQLITAASDPTAPALTIQQRAAAGPVNGQSGDLLRFLTFDSNPLTSVDAAGNLLFHQNTTGVKFYGATGTVPAYILAEGTGGGLRFGLGTDSSLVKYSFRDYEDNIIFEVYGGEEGSYGPTLKVGDPASYDATLHLAANEDTPTIFFGEAEDVGTTNYIVLADSDRHARFTVLDTQVNLYNAYDTGANLQDNPIDYQRMEIGYRGGTYYRIGTAAGGTYSDDRGIQIDSPKLGFFGATPVTQPATPILLSDVISALQSLGLVA